MIRPGLLAARPAAAESSYHADAVNFDGSTWLSIASLSAPDTALYSMVFWANMGADPGNPILSVVDPLDTYTNFCSLADHPRIALYNGADRLRIDSNVGFADSGWRCLIMSAETNFPTGEKKAKLYVGDDDAGSIVFDDGPFTMLFSGLPFVVGTDLDGADLVGDIADLRIMPGVSLFGEGADIPLVTRRLFIDANGKPVNPAVATAALGVPGAMLFSGDATGFATNQGAGGAFTLTGSFTDADSSPSDP